MDTGNELFAKINAWIDSHAEEMLDDLTRLINTKSVLARPETGAPYGRGAADALDLSRKIMKKLGIETSVFEDCMAEGDIPGERGGEPELGLLVHVDTVDADPSEWRSDPFRADIRDGGEDCVGSAVYGRGSTDNKGPAVAAMYALACAREIGQLKKGARIIVGSAEEIGCADIARYLEKRSPPPLVIAPDAEYPLVNVEKGRFLMRFGGEWSSESENTDAVRIISIRGGGTDNIVPGAAEAVLCGTSADIITPPALAFSEKTGADITVSDDPRGVIIKAYGKASHASRPDDGVNAQTALLAFLDALPLADTNSARAARALARLFPHGDYHGAAMGLNMRDDISGTLTLSFDVLDMNETGFTASFDSRTPAIADTRDISGIAKAALEAADLRVTEISKTLCHHTPEDSALVQTLMSIYREYTGDTETAPLALGGMTYVHGIPGGVAFGTQLPGENNRIHGRDEFIGVRELLLSAKMLARAIIELCG
ncbi:MAG: Sapep family Mn(2+)-dependent dipeptidase [Oscillospiraceae bacterium]|jgi:succinyl-diaminopimelate desuccinylase|nr:Sapep family Mn(2+)-dependent dipeptidase [Oscillospiraceae bacterium]